ncbi:uncharacterized protein [Melanerpes formicivorus]|uniref:uncharacterized protein n=1 Tax=Melanerpes formicivorus TaxID=211600 RepID=UPI00358F5877
MRLRGSVAAARRLSGGAGIVRSGREIGLGRSQNSLPTFSDKPPEQDERVQPEDNLQTTTRGHQRSPERPSGGGGGGRGEAERGQARGPVMNMQISSAIKPSAAGSLSEDLVGIPSRDAALGPRPLRGIAGAPSPHRGILGESLRSPERRALSYILDSQNQWPKNGTLNKETIQQLTKLCERQNKWLEVIYVTLFSTLRNHPEWQTGTSPRDSQRVVLEERKREEEDGRSSRPGAVDLSVSHRAPGQGKAVVPGNAALKQGSGGLAGAGEAAASPEGTGTGKEGKSVAGSRSSAEGPAARTGRKRAEPPTPSGEALGPDGSEVRLRAPLSGTELSAWQEILRNCSRDPEKVAKRFQLLVKNHDPEWLDIDVLLDALGSATKAMVISAAREEVQALLRRKQPGVTVDEVFPLTEPSWDPKNPDDRAALKRYQAWVVYGLKRGIPKRNDLPRLYEIYQEPRESPSAFWSRLKAAAEQCADLDPENPRDEILLATLFVRQLKPSISQELDKLSHRGISSLLHEAERVYRDREEDFQQTVKELLDAVKEVQWEIRAARERGRGRNELPGRAWPGLPAPARRLARDQCAICRERGHWQRECPQRLVAPALRAIEW